MRAAALLLVLVAAWSAPAQSPPQPRLTLVDTARFASRDLSESSGVVESRRHPGLLWTHNDSDNEPYLFATDSSGADRGRVLVRRARNDDWEDLSIGPCPLSSGTCLFIADIGDNTARRPSVSIYVVPEPAEARGETEPEAILEFRYPDGPHNAEALAITGDTLLVVTKNQRGPATLYRGRVAVGLQTLERVTDLAMETSALRGRIATGAAISRDGRILAVRTYVSLHLFAIDRGFAPLARPHGIGLPVVETQGEGVCFDRAGRILLTTERGQRGHAMLTRLRLENLEGGGAP